MKGLATLVRLNQRTVDEKRNALTRLEQTRSELVAAERRLERSLIDEQQRVSASDEAGYTFPLFTEGVIAKRGALAAAREEIASLIEEAKSELVHAYQEFKKYDFTEMRRRTRIRALEKKQEQVVLDEVAINQFIRKRQL